MADDARWNPSSRAHALGWMTRWVDPVLVFLASMSIPMLIVQTGSPTADDLRSIVGASWLIWGAFTANFAVRIAIAPNRRTELRGLAFDLILIVGQPIYTLGEQKADAVLAFVRLLVVLGRTLQKGRLLRRTGHKLRSQPLRVVAFIVPFLWTTSGALIYRFEIESGTVGSFDDGLWWSAVTMATVGYGDISPKTERGRVVGVATMIAGIGMFSLVTAKLAEVLFLQRTRSSRRDVLETGHTLILGWSSKVFTIVEQLVVANEDRRDPAVVVLAPIDHNDASEAIHAHVPALEHSNTTLVCRTGSPGDPADLAVCRPDRARAIVVIDDSEEDASVVRAVLALLHGGAPLPDIPVVAEIDDAATAAALRHALEGRVTVVNPTSFVARTAAQACRSAGIARAYEDLLRFEGSELYLHHEPGATGQPFGALLNAFTDACLVGIHHGGRADLNPAPDTIVGPDDSLLVLAVDDSRITFDAALVSPLGDAAPESHGRPSEHVVVFGWNALGPRIVAELDHFVAPGSRVTVALDPAHAGPSPVEAGALANTTVTVRSATDVEYADLVEVIAEEDADHAIVLCYRDTLSIAEADARALVTTLQVRRAFAARGRDTTVVTELLDQRDVALAPPSAVGDFIVSDRLVSLLVTQLAENARLAPVFDDLLDPGGAELYCKPAHRYCAPGAPVTFAEIVTAAGRRRECTIGYRQFGASTDGSSSFGVVLNPRKSTEVTLAPGDQVIVLAED